MTEQRAQANRDAQKLVAACGKGHLIFFLQEAEEPLVPLDKPDGGLVTHKDDRTMTDTFGLVINETGIDGRYYCLRIGVNNSLALCHSAVVPGPEGKPQVYDGNTGPGAGVWLDNNVFADALVDYCELFLIEPAAAPKPPEAKKGDKK